MINVPTFFQKSSAAWTMLATAIWLQNMHCFLNLDSSHHSYEEICVSFGLSVWVNWHTASPQMYMNKAHGSRDIWLKPAEKQKLACQAVTFDTTCPQECLLGQEKLILSMMRQQALSVFISIAVACFCSHSPSIFLTHLIVGWSMKSTRPWVFLLTSGEG